MSYEVVTIRDCTLYRGDCLEVLRSFSDDTINTSVTSPPYNQKLNQFKASGFKAEGNAVWAERASSSYFDSLPESEYRHKQVSVLNALHKVSTYDGSVFYNHKCRWRDTVLLHPLDIFRESEWTMRQEIIWSRDGSLTQNAKMFPPSEERIIWGYKTTWKWNAESNKWMSVWRINSEHNSIHPVAYPLDIPERCIEASTRSGDTVCDPFMGSGTTGVACVNLGRKFIGIEIEPKYFDIACKRIEKAYADQALLDIAEQAEETQPELAFTA